MDKLLMEHYSRTRLATVGSVQFGAQLSIKEIVKLNCYLNRSYQLINSLVRKSETAAARN